PEVPPTPVPTSATHLCPPTCAAHQCHPPVQPSSAASQCHHQCRQSVPSSDASQLPSINLPISVTYQCCILVPPIRDTSLVLPISAL
ncbi:unnamed protein product, partial [Staurois parvus]